MKSEKGKYHFYLSIVKSILRIIGCFFGMTLREEGGILILAITFALAEILGIIEEFVDER